MLRFKQLFCILLPCKPPVVFHEYCSENSVFPTTWVRFQFRRYAVLKNSTSRYMFLLHSRTQSRDPSDLRQGSRALAGPDFLSMCRVFVSYSQPIRFARFDGKSVNRGLPVLDKARALDPCRRSEGSWLWRQEWFLLFLALVVLRMRGRVFRTTSLKFVNFCYLDYLYWVHLNLRENSYFLKQIIKMFNFMGNMPSHKCGALIAYKNVSVPSVQSP